MVGRATAPPIKLNTKQMGGKMKIKLLVSRASATGSQNRGDVIDVGDAEAIRMMEAGQAEPLRVVEIERAVAGTKPERARK